MFDGIINFLKSENFIFQLELFFRIILAFFCGAFIGRERKYRGKGAGNSYAEFKKAWHG